jgi:prepilin-type N-terminal cleavage/methylation domain-containing protein
MRHSKDNKKGFTILELLVVISIMVILSTVVFAFLGAARERSKIAKAKAEIQQFATSTILLQNDTGKWLNGCPPGVREDFEVSLDSTEAGIMYRPLGVASGLPQTPPCVWSDQEIASWKGPYARGAIDPWGHPYLFDPDYCPDSSGDTTKFVPIISSIGPDGKEEYGSACGGTAPKAAPGTKPDDIIYYLPQ